MPKIEIRLTEGSLDLFLDAEDKFYITKQIHDLRDLTTRKASFSKTMTIPRTKNNSLLLGEELVEFGRDNSQPYRFVDCQVFMSSHPILPDGRLKVIVEKTVSNTIDIAIFGGVVNLFELLSDNPLGSLPLSEYSFEWNLSSIANYVDTDEGFLFAQNTWFSNNNWRDAINKEISPTIILNDPDIRYSGAWMYVKTIMTKIFETMPQLTIDNSVLEALSDYDKMVVALPVTRLFENFTAPDGFNGFVEVNNRRQDMITGTPNNIYRAVFPIILNDNPSLFWNPTLNQFEVTESGYFNIDVSMIIRGFGDNPFGYGSVRLISSGVELFRDGIILGNRSYNHQFSVFVNVGETIHIEYLSASINVGNNTGLYATGTFTVKGSGSVASDFVDISEYMPDISQKDFVKEIFNLFHAIPTYADGVTTISLWDEIPERQQTDLTKYLDSKKEITRVGLLSGYAQNNKFEYTVHETVDRQGTDYEFEMRNELLPSDAVKIKSIFSPSEQSLALDYLMLSAPLLPLNYEKITNNNISVNAGSPVYTTSGSNNIKVGDLIFVRNAGNNGFQGRRRVDKVTNNRSGLVDVDFDQSSSYGWEKFSYSKQDIGIRIGQVFDQGEATVRDGGINWVVPAMKGITFPDGYLWNSLASKFFSNLLAMLEKPDVATAWFRLPTYVFYNLSLLDPVYVVDRVYYINKIEQYNFSRFCRMELIEIKDNNIFFSETFYIVTPNPLNWEEVEQSETINLKTDILNNGDVAIEFSLSVITGSDASYFAFNPVLPATFTVEPGQVQEVLIDFTADTSFGSKFAEFTVQSINPDIFDVDVTLHAFIKSPANYILEPENVVFVNTPAGFITVATTRVVNTGLGSIAFTLDAITGSSEFSYQAGQSLSFTVLEGEFELITLEFESIGPLGLKSGEFIIESVTPDIFDTTVLLFGQTVVNSVSYTVDPNPLDFGSKAHNAPPTTEFTTVTNTGAETINFTLSNIVGDQYDEFYYAVGQPTAFTLDPGQSEEIQITWDTANPKVLKQSLFTVEANHPFVGNTDVDLLGLTT